MKSMKKTKLAAFSLSAMTFCILASSLIPSLSLAFPFDGGSPFRRPRPVVPKSYVLVGTDAQSNPYQGDTSTSEAHGLLCIKKDNLPKPAVIPAPETTPGGALKNSWSGGSLFVVPNVQGTRLTSKAVADGICDQYGQSTYGISGFRMAEFHDGDKQSGWAGWSFWGDTTDTAKQGLEGFSDRLWVVIDDQEANPWGIYSQSSNGEIRNALTFTKLNAINN